MSNSNEFLKAIAILTEEYGKDKDYKEALSNEVERLLQDNKEKDKIIENQRKEIEALKQHKNRYIEIEDKYKIIIYDTKEDKFTWRTYWSQLPCNIIDDLYKNELMNYYKTNVLKVVKKGEFIKEQLYDYDWYERNFYYNSGNCVNVNSEFSVPLLKQIQNVRGFLRNMKNMNNISVTNQFHIHKYLYHKNKYDDNCIGYTKSGERCKCKGRQHIYYYLKEKDEALHRYLRDYKNIPDMYICARHIKTVEKDYTQLIFWISTFLETFYDINLDSDKKNMINKLYTEENLYWNDKNIQ